MKKNRREFLKYTGLTGIGVAGAGMIKGLATENEQPASPGTFSPGNGNQLSGEKDVSVIGAYGKWAAGLNKGELPSLSYRRSEFKDLAAWKDTARKRVIDRMAIPDIGGIPEVNVVKSYTYDGLQIEELKWQLPYGRATEAVLLKPVDKKGRLPGILAFHDHGGNKYFGNQKIIRTTELQHPLIREHQREYYESLAWANEMAKRGYVVLVPDAFPFGSRRVMPADVPAKLRKGLNNDDPGKPENIKAYNDWAGTHEHIMAKSLFSAGTTWPGVFFAEDQKALDVLCARPDVDAGRIGCGGLSGGGMRTAFLGGLDSRISCAVCVGFMTTWKDFVLNKSFTHTWMTYVPLLPNELDFPEILALRAPLPTLIVNDEDDELFTLAEMKEADQVLKDIFSKAGAGDRYKGSFYPGPHKFDAKMQAEAFGWFDRWLQTPLNKS